MPNRKFSNKILGYTITSQHSQISRIEKVDKKLAGWKRRTLSIARHLVLINSIVRSLPIYWMAVLHIPVNIIQKMDRLCQAFLWDVMNTGSKIKYLVNWTQVRRPKIFGGLDIPNLSYVNQVLPLKWWFKFYIDSDKPWCKLIRSIYYSKRTPADPSSYLTKSASPLWRSIVKLHNIFQHFSIFIGHDGRQTSFWHDTW